MKEVTTLRTQISHARRIVVKVGSRVLIQRTGRPDLPRMRALVDDLADLRQEGRDVVLVSSGAIGVGIEALGMRTRPTRVPDLQMAAAVGQFRLMGKYGALFARHRCTVGQILLTHDDLRNRTRHLNARNTMMNLLRNGIIPIVNENDVVATDEIKFGDNDQLASLVAMLIDADLLILLSTVDGVRKPIKGGRTRRISYMASVTRDIEQLVHGKGSMFSTGGMASKLESARQAAGLGVPAVIANGRKSGIITQIMAGRDVGTLLGGAATGAEEKRGRKRWIAFFNKPEGTLVVDDGACDALLKKGRSLLPIGVRKVEGTFEAGAVVNIRSMDGAIIARGLSEFSSQDARQIAGRKTSEIKTILGRVDDDEIVHRDQMSLLGHA
jgi:glutamate 5-kinase